MVTEISLHLGIQYKQLLRDLKDQIRSTRLKAAVAINHELILLYWRIGKQILEKQAQADWGSKFLETLSRDLQSAFPETYGFSVRNLKYMRQFAQIFSGDTIGQQAVAQLPWGHICLLIQRVKLAPARNWYIQQSIENGWSRHTLDRQIKQDLYARQAIQDNKASNFSERLPTPHASLAQAMLKSPYNFDFLGLHDEALEREIEHASIQHITKFMLELGKGFAFVGQQVSIVIDDQEFFIDMLFYNLRLRSYVVCEIKSTKFKPEHTGQLNFYCNAVDDLMRHPDDAPTIGLLLCKSRNKVVAEYALKSIEKPIGVSEYELVKAIPESLQLNLPTIEEIELELSGESKQEAPDE